MSIAVAAWVVLALVALAALVLALRRKVTWTRASYTVLALLIAVLILSFVERTGFNTAVHEVVRTWDTAWRVVLCVGILLLAISSFIAILAMEMPVQEKAFAVGALLIAAIVCWNVVWMYGSSTPPGRRQVAAYAPVPVQAPNTSSSCPGILQNVALGREYAEVNPNGCFMYWGVKTGRVILSGPAAEREVGPEGADLMGLVFYWARAASDTAQLSYLNCAGPKRDMSTVDCR